jgi:hypothetical protein
VITSWCRVLLRNLTVVQLFKQSPKSYHCLDPGGSIVCSHVTTPGPYPDTVEFNPHIQIQYFQVYFNIILSRMQRFPKWFCFPTKILYASAIPHVCYISRPFKCILLQPSSIFYNSLTLKSINDITRFW